MKAEKEVCYTEQAVADTKRALGEKHKAHNKAVAAVSSRSGHEQAECDGEPWPQSRFDLQKLAGAGLRSDIAASS